MKLNYTEGVELYELLEKYRKEEDGRERRYILSKISTFIEGRELDVAMPDINAGALNTKRIKAYKRLAYDYDVEESTIREVFSKGAEFYKLAVEVASKKAEPKKGKALIP